MSATAIDSKSAMGLYACYKKPLQKECIPAIADAYDPSGAAVAAVVFGTNSATIKTVKATVVGYGDKDDAGENVSSFILSAKLIPRSL